MAELPKVEPEAASAFLFQKERIETARWQLVNIVNQLRLGSKDIYNWAVLTVLRHKVGGRK